MAHTMIATKAVERLIECDDDFEGMKTCISKDFMGKLRVRLVSARIYKSILGSAVVRNSNMSSAVGIMSVKFNKNHSRGIHFTFGHTTDSMVCFIFLPHEQPYLTLHRRLRTCTTVWRNQIPSCPVINGTRAPVSVVWRFAASRNRTQYLDNLAGMQDGLSWVVKDFAKTSSGKPPWSHGQDPSLMVLWSSHTPLPSTYATGVPGVLVFVSLALAFFFSFLPFFFFTSTTAGFPP